MKNKTKLSGKNNQIIGIKYLLCLLLALGTTATNAQKNYKKVFDENKKYQRVQLADSAYRYNFVVLSTASKMKPDIEKSYTWYIDNSINTTQGNYSNKLLHGLFVKYFIGSNQLAAKGEYKYGLQVGNWYEWRENGNLISVVEYKAGQKQGDAIFYDTLGNITEKCYFKDDKKAGKSITYVDGVEQAPVKYKDGEVKEKKQKKQKKDDEVKEKKKPFFKKILFWKKEKKSEN